MEGLRARLDCGELGGENPDPRHQGDGADHALRLAEFESRINDDKRLGVSYADGARPWRETSEEHKLWVIASHMHELRLDSDVTANAILDREVDQEQVREWRFLLAECVRDWECERPEGRQDAFDRAVANLREQWDAQWHDNPFAEMWEDLDADDKICFLAAHAVKHGVSFARFAEAAPNAGHGALAGFHRGR